MKLSKFILGALAICAVLVLSACGSDPGQSGSGSNQSGQSGQSAQTNIDCSGKKSLSAEGSSAQKNAIDVFVQAYQAACPGSNVAYNPTGSGAGVKQFNAGLVDFAGSDSALKDGAETTAASQRCKSNPAWNLPLVFGPVAIAYKLQGVSSLTLDGPTAAKIFSGQLTTWNDPAIAALNSGATLPSAPIKVVFRSDDSGTTENFQAYLTAASKGAWTKGAGRKFVGGVGSGAERSAGVAQAVGATEGSITYVELSFAQDNKLSMAKIDTGSGPVELTDATVGKAIEGAKITGQGNDLKLDLATTYAATTSDAYPLILATYEIVCSKGYEADTAKAVKAFLTVAATTGQAKLSDAGYAPLPETFKQKLLAAVSAIS